MNDKELDAQEVPEPERLAQRSQRPKHYEKQGRPTRYK